MFKKALLLTVIIIAALCGCGGSKGGDGSMSDYKEPKGGYAQLNPPDKGEEIAVITTNYGVIKVRLFLQYAPKAVENFTTHAKDGYYEGVIFHRVIEDFMVQGGDPTGTGRGGYSIWGRPFGPELTPQLHHIRGALSMAQADSPDPTIGSQFFIVQNTDVGSVAENWFNGMLKNPDKTYTNARGASKRSENGKYYLAKELYPEPFIKFYLENGGTPHLDFIHTVFGQVFEGMDIVDTIAAVEIYNDEENRNPNRPVEDVVIESVSIEKY